MADRPSIRSAMGRAPTLPGIGPANPPSAATASIEKLMEREGAKHWSEEMAPAGREQEIPTEQVVTRSWRQALYFIGVGVGLGVFALGIGLVIYHLVVHAMDKPPVAKAAVDHSKHIQVRGDVVQLANGTYKVSTWCAHDAPRLPTPILPSATK